MTENRKTREELLAEVNELKIRLMECEETLNAIQSGEVDALVVSGPNEEQVYTLKGADYAYRVLIEEMSEGVAMLTPDRTIFYCNNQLASILRVPMEEIIGKSMDEFIPLDQLQKCQMPPGEDLTSRCKEEIVIRAKDGALVPATISFRFLKRIDGFNIVINDITRQKKAEKEIQRSRESFRALAENSPDIIIRLDRNLRYVYVNSIVTEITGQPPEYYIGKTYEETGIPEKLATYWKESNLKALETGEIQYQEFEFPANNGLRFIESTIVPEFSDKGEIKSLLVLSRDITERKNAEIQLEQMVQELKRSNDELQQFAYVASHDLQEPLRTIASFTQLLERRYKDKLDSDADEFMDYIVDATKRMQRLIKDLLEYSRVTTKGKEFKPTDIEEVLKSTIFNLRGTIKENQAEITHDPLPEVMADERQLIQLFQNLISNAIKFRKPEIPPKIHIYARKDEENNEYVFSIADNGIGIEPQYQSRIFTIFQRLHSREEYTGTGVGLAVSRKVIERNGGRIWVESEFGKGSTFYFTIPIERV